MSLHPSRPQDSINLSNSNRLRIFTKLLREPIVVSGSAYRSGAHPILATRVAAEVARSPKVGLVQKLMEEGRKAFLDEDFPRAIIKSLAAEELLRKYGGILAPKEDSRIRAQLQFLKIQYFLLSGQAGEAHKALRSIGLRSHPYLWHKRLAYHCGVGSKHWNDLEAMLRQFFITNRSDKIFALLGYVIVMGSAPYRAGALKEEMDFEPGENAQLFYSLYQDYNFLTTRVTQKEKRLLPEYLAFQYQATPIIQEGETVFLAHAGGLSQLDMDEISLRVGSETIFIPMSANALEDRNYRLYAA